MRANPYVRRAAAELAARFQHAAPVDRFHRCADIAARRAKNSCSPVSRATSRLGGSRNISSFAPNAAMRPRESTSNLLAQPVRLFDVVRHQQRRPPERGECLLKLRLHLAAQVRIERGERLIQQQRFRFDRQRPRQRRPLLLAPG